MGTFGSTGDERATSTAIDSSGNVYVVGRFTGTVDFDPSSAVNSLTSYGSTDVFITKTSPNGDLLWVKRLGGTDADVGNGISVDGSGNVITVGLFKSSAYFNPADSTTAILTAPAAAGTNQIFVSKLDTDGNYLWAKNFGCACGSYNSNVTGVSVDSSTGAIFTVGSVPQATDFDPGPASDTKTLSGNYDFFLQKLNSSGIYEWAFTLGAGGNESSFDVTASNSGDVVVTGVVPGPANVNFNPRGTSSILNTGNFLARYSPTGILRWAKSLPGTLSSIREDTGNNFVLGGALSGGTDLDFDPDTGTAYLNSTNGLGFLLKLNSSGSFTWVKQLPAAAQFVNTDGDSILATGSFAGSADFDPGAGVVTLTSTYSSGTTYSNDLYVTKFDSSGNLLWAKSSGGSGDLTTAGVVVTPSHDSFIAGNFTSVGDFGPSPCVMNFTSKGSYDVFYLALNSNGRQFAPPSPTYSSLTVATGNVSGGTSSKVIGSNLLCTTGMTVGGNPATISATTDTSVTFSTPVGSVGAKDVLLITPFETITAPAAFLYFEIVSSFSNFSIAGNVSTTAYRTPILITATVAYASRITIRYAGVRIPGCISKLTSASAPFTMTCSWSPSRKGGGALTAVAVPTSGGVSTGYSSPINVTVGGRTNTR